MASNDGEYSPKRQYIRKKAQKRCILRMASGDKACAEAMVVETVDHSNGGLGIIYDGIKLSVGNKVLAYIEALSVSRKEAEVVWLKHLNGSCTAGLRWL